MPGAFFCFLIKLQNENVKFHLFYFRRLWSRVSGTGSKGCQLCRSMPVFGHSAKFCPLDCYLTFIAPSLKNPTGLKCPDSSPFPNEHFKIKKKKIKKGKKISTFTISLKRGMDFTPKPSLLYDLPTLLDFLMNADGQAKEAVVIHTFFGYGKEK